MSPPFHLTQRCPGKLLAFPGLPLAHLGSCQAGQGGGGEPPNRTHSHGDLPNVVPDYTTRSRSSRLKRQKFCEQNFS